MFHFDGIADMKRLPGAIYVVDPRKEHIAVTEAKPAEDPRGRDHRTPTCDPDLITYVIPGNDDAIRAVKLLTGKMPTRARRDARRPRPGARSVPRSKSGVSPKRLRYEEIEEYLEDEERLPATVSEEEFVARRRGGGSLMAKVSMDLVKQLREMSAAADGLARTRSRG